MDQSRDSLCILESAEAGGGGGGGKVQSVFWAGWNYNVGAHNSGKRRTIDRNISVDAPGFSGGTRVSPCTT